MPDLREALSISGTRRARLTVNLAPAELAHVERLATSAGAKPASVARGLLLQGLEHLQAA